VNVSLLVNFRKDQGILDWDIGKNGIILHLKRNGKYYEATYLPEVAQ
jgi:AMMECR1 domain-containing protein